MDFELWRFPATRPTTFDMAYRTFNLCEAIAWFVCAVLVAVRWKQFRRSRLEPWYAVAFLLFGLTDLGEASRLDVPLLMIKLVLLIALSWLRRKVRPLYPDSTML